MIGQIKLITLITDFGKSYYVGEMKGAIKKVDPEAEIIDITHSIHRYNVAEGAFVLSRVWRHFPKNTVHLIVIDPGVGSPRKAIGLQTDYTFLIGPDNGVLRWAIRDQKVMRAVELDPLRVQESAGLSLLSATFHGRDLFAPAAALLTKGVDLDMLGKRVEDIAKLDLREDTVVHVDGFGNIVTTVGTEIKPGTTVMVAHGTKTYGAKAVRTFSDAKPGELIVLTGSHGLLEVDINQGSAAELLGAESGDPIGVEYVG